MQLSDSRVLVIGGARFIGSHVVSELLQTDVSQVVVYDGLTRGKTSNLKESLDNSRCQIFPDGGDTRDNGDFKRAIV